MDTAIKIARFSVYASIAAILLAAIVMPTNFGRWLQKIDTGRFEMIDCDCTEPLE